MKPKLSVVIVHFDMARELPKTLESLTPPLQKGVDPGEVEFIVIDNGSRNPADCRALAAQYPNARFVDYPTPTVSPVAACNYGVSLAQADLIGLFVDGARMASPGLLKAALDASGLAPQPVIGAVGMHLGPKVQMESVNDGYDQVAEDALLDSVDWRADPYRLFDISCLAGSSRRGLFHPIAETNSLFMKARCWRELGALDPGFTSVGGGYANLDLWRRAVLRPDATPILLLAEATFHQIHGGVATNRPSPPHDVWSAEYRRLRNENFRAPERQVLFAGPLASPKLLARSVNL